MAGAATGIANIAETISTCVRVIENTARNRRDPDSVVWKWVSFTSAGRRCYSPSIAPRPPPEEGAHGWVVLGCDESWRGRCHPLTPALSPEGRGSQTEARWNPLSPLGRGSG